jgi:hypothetical protein
MKTPLPALSAAAVTALLLAAPAAWAGVYIDDHGPNHAAWARQSQHNGVGGMVMDGGLAGSCSGAAINSGTGWANRWVLTAAHCVTDVNTVEFLLGNDLGPTQMAEQAGVVGWAEAWYVPDTYDGNVVSGSDIALVRLRDELPDDVPVYGLYEGSDEINSVYRHVGYGTHGTGATGATTFDGQKRSGDNIFDGQFGIFSDILVADLDVDPSDSGYPGPNPRAVGDPEIPGQLSPQSDFRIDREYIVAPGDSGGPAFIGDQIAGVASFGEIPFGYYNQVGYVRVSAWTDWIYNVIDQVESDLADDPSLEISGLVPAGTAQAGVLLGAPDIPITVDGGGFGDGDDDTSRGVYRDNAELLIRYFNHKRTGETPLNLNDLLRLLSISPDDPTDVQEIFTALGLGAAPSDLALAAELATAEANAQLDEATQALLWDIPLNDEDGNPLPLSFQQSGFYTGRADWATLVPEPATATLLALSLLALPRRRRGNA